MTRRDYVHGALLTITTLVGVVALMVIFTFGIGQWIRETAGWSGKTQQINQTRGNGSYRIAAYDHFFDLCAAVQNQEVTIKAQQDELATGPSADRKEQIHANISALTANRNELINQYNADASKTATQGQFRSSHLPYQLDSTEAHTTCAI